MSRLTLIRGFAPPSLAKREKDFRCAGVKVSRGIVDPAKETCLWGQTANSLERAPFFTAKQGLPRNRPVIRLQGGEAVLRQRMRGEERDHAALLLAGQAEEEFAHRNRRATQTAHDHRRVSIGARLGVS